MLTLCTIGFTSRTWSRASFNSESKPTNSGAELQKEIMELKTYRKIYIISQYYAHKQQYKQQHVSTNKPTTLLTVTNSVAEVQIKILYFL